MTGARAPSPAQKPLRRGVLWVAASLIFGGAPGNGAAQDGAGDAARLNPLSSLRPSDLRSFRERPLFTPSRKPPPVAPSLPESAPVEADVGDEPPNVRLTGVIQGPAAATAVLERPDASGKSTVRIGDAVDGWTVAAIDLISIKLASGTRLREYRLFARSSLPVSGPDHAAAPDPGGRDVVR